MMHVGTFGDIGTLSFYPAHHITMGEGEVLQFFKNKESMDLKRLGRDCWCNTGCIIHAEKFGWI